MMNIKHFLYGATAVLAVSCFSACYSDDSTLETEATKVEQVTITDEGENIIYTGFLEQLVVSPSVSRGTNTSPAGLTYKWEITETPSTTQRQAANWIELGTEPELRTEMIMPVNTAPYTLRLTVTDTENGGLQNFYTWLVYVNSAFLDGIVVADTRDGATSDLSLIMNDKVTLNFSGNDRVLMQILENASEKINGLVTQLTYNILGTFWGSHTNQLWTVTDDGELKLFDTQEFTVTLENAQEAIIPLQAGQEKVEKLFMSDQFFFAKTNTSLYQINPQNFHLFGAADAVGSTYDIDNNVVATIHTFNTSYQTAVWYDASKSSFVYVNPSIMGITYGTDWTANESFDPANVPGCTAVAAEMTVDGKTPAMLLKDKSTGEYAIYTLTRYVAEQGTWNDDWTEYTMTSPEVPCGAGNKYVIPAAGKQLLDQAVSTFFAINQSLLYVATPDGIYVINFAGQTVSVGSSPVYTPDSGETISKAGMFTQGVYNVSSTELDEGGNYTEAPWHAKAVIVATQSGEYEGKVSLVPMTQIGTGNLDKSQAKTYSGFGKILDFCSLGK